MYKFAVFIQIIGYILMSLLALMGLFGCCLPWCGAVAAGVTEELTGGMVSLAVFNKNNNKRRGADNVEEQGPNRIRIAN